MGLTDSLLLFNNEMPVTRGKAGRVEMRDENRKVCFRRAMLNVRFLGATRWGAIKSEADVCIRS